MNAWVRLCAKLQHCVLVEDTDPKHIIHKMFNLELQRKQMRDGDGKGDTILAMGGGLVQGGHI